MIKALIFTIIIAVTAIFITLNRGTMNPNSEKLSERLLPQEFERVIKIANNIGNTELLSEYYKWLKKKGDNERAEFIKQYSTFIETMELSDAPNSDGFDNEWLNLIGYNLLYLFIEEEQSAYKDVICQAARPALQTTLRNSSDNQIPVGATKIGGVPDLPADFIWPKGKDCGAVYFKAQPIEEYAGFVAQINLSDFKNTSVENRIKTSGVVSIFCYHKFDFSNNEVMGVKLYYFDTATQLIRTQPDIKFTDGNHLIEEVTEIQYRENLQLPSRDNPVGKVLPQDDWDFDSVQEYYEQENRDFFCGFYEPTRIFDPTPDTTIQNFFRISNSMGVEIDLMLPLEDLKQGIFENIEVPYVNYDP